MAERSHFLVLLSQGGWDRAELGAGRVEALVEREGSTIEARIHEGSTLLSRVASQGAGARGVIGGMRVVEGIWLDALGEEAAWAKSLEALIGMKSISLGMDAPGPERDALGGGLGWTPDAEGEA